MLGKGKSEKKNDILQKMLADYADKPSVQEKIKLAFAEGYASKHPDAGPFIFFSNFLTRNYVNVSVEIFSRR